MTPTNTIPAKKVYIAYVGGTIGMTRTANGHVPAPGFLQEQMKAMPELEHELMPDFDIHEYEPLLDSSNMSPDDWVHIAQDIYDHYTEYDGFIILHGTDTMPYTASALSFMLQNLGKTVVITGSQLPLVEIRNDARLNLINALLIASRYRIPEVCLYFNSKLFRGNRTRKVNASGFDAFGSPNYPPLGHAGVEVAIDWNMVLPWSSDACELLPPVILPNVAHVQVFPGMSVEVFRNLVQPPIQGLILETYGTGNAPDKNPEFLKVLRDATERGVVIVSCTQCLQGTVNLDQYATGSAIKNAGVISGFDMTPEAALTKLFYLTSLGLSPERIRNLMQCNLRGELTGELATYDPGMLRRTED
jgi:L-asparaginase